jgi:hypothetical protein
MFLVALRFAVLYCQADTLVFRLNDGFVAAAINGRLWQAWAAAGWKYRDGRPVGNRAEWAALAEAIEQTGMACVAVAI